MTAPSHEHEAQELLARIQRLKAKIDEWPAGDLGLGPHRRGAKKRCISVIRFAALVAVFAFCPWLLTGLASAAPSAVAIVVNTSTPVDGLTMTELRRIFLGDRQFWGPGQRIVLLVRAPTAPERNVVLHSIYQMSEAEFRQYWIAKVFRAEITSGPKVVYSTEMTNELIPAIPGAIGFEPAGQAKAGEKVLRINGKLPGEQGYPLQ